MTTRDKIAPEHPGDLEKNLARVDALTKRLVAVLGRRKLPNPALNGPGQDLYVKAATAYMAEMMRNPARIFEQQVSYWTDSVRNFAQAQGVASAPDDAPVDAKDPRFSNPMWEANPFFHFLKQQYMANAHVVRQAIDDAEDLSPSDRKRLAYFVDQIVEMMAPTNFLGTNPEALERALETQGQSLIDGLENLVRDLEAHDGEMVVSLADPDAFQVGGNLATTPGQVVFRNRMLELIQYAPTTESVHQTPLVVFPPWINKYYILDLKQKNSLVKWLTDQGFTVFVVSWVNPDPSYREVGILDYVQDGYLQTIDVVRQICDVPKVNVVGYCIAGTTLAMTLSLLQQQKRDLIESATFFTTLTDFADQGEFGVFLNDDFLDGIDAEMAQEGILSSVYMARTFSFLRSRDLIYGPAINSYMLGKAPPAFDLLHWNGDGTNLPAKMASEYLRGLCQHNELARGVFELGGHKMSLADVKVPLCAIACETDHIANWKSSLRGVQQMGSRSKTFILSQSGHIGGIVNPPSKKKYGHYTNRKLAQDPDSWRAGASFHEGSWWPRWGAWLAKRSGAQVGARCPGARGYPCIVPAPGRYVLKCE